jgi:hypothetical protein
MKELAIRDYISKVNWKANWNYKVIEEDMRRFLGERPSLEPEYKKDVFINEVTGEAKEISKLEKISVIFTDLDNRIKKITFLI